MHHVTLMAQAVGVQFMPCWLLPEDKSQACHLLLQAPSYAVTAGHHNAGPGVRNRLHEHHISDGVNHGGSCEMKQDFPAAAT